MENSQNRRRTDVTAPLAQFAIAGLLAVVLVGVVGLALLRHAARNDAIEDAKTVARLAGRGIVEPNLTKGVLEGEPEELRRFDQLVRTKIIDREGIIRVKLWKADGKIIYSDQASLIGKRFPVPEDERHALETGEAAAELTNLTRAENQFERGEGQLLEVYLPVQAPTGEELLFEVYERGSTIATNTKTTWMAFLPALLGALLLLQLLQLPLAHRMARRLHQNRIEREELLLRSIKASETERRQIASDLHDGVVQDLAGTSYSLTAAADRLNGHATPEAAEALRDAARQTRRSIRQLRSLLVDIYPPDLHRAGLSAALCDLVAPLESRGMQTKVDLPPALNLQPAAEALMFRTAQEALRNVIAHSRATRVDVSVSLVNSHAELRIVDDGRGFTSDEVDAARADGHLGLRVLGDMARDAGGRLDISSEPGHGTRVQLEMPVA